MCETLLRENCQLLWYSTSLALYVATCNYGNKNFSEKAITLKIRNPLRYSLNSRKDLLT